MKTRVAPKTFGATLGHRPSNISNRNAVAVIPIGTSHDICHNRVAVEFGFDDFPRWPRKLGNVGLEANAPLGHSICDTPSRAEGCGSLGLANDAALVHSGFMPQSLSAVYIHLVFSTKDRRLLLRDKSTRHALHSYLGGISKQLDCAPIQIGGVEDHVHVLARFGRTITQAEWAKELKRVSNAWLKERGPDFADFQWQGGYAAFSVSQSNLEKVKQYIASQEQHHRKMNFQDELRGLLRRHEMEWDEKYVWD